MPYPIYSFFYKMSAVCPKGGGGGGGGNFIFSSYVRVCN